jgi:hypothetical protein
MALLIFALGGAPGAAGAAKVHSGKSPRAATPKIVWGIGDQQPQMFFDTRWRLLPLRHVSYFVPWDLVHEPIYLREANQWMAIALANGAVPLIVITQSDIHGRTRYLPSVSEYIRDVGWIMHHFPWVRSWTPWNEANLLNQATLHDPGRAVAYWKALRRRCRSCTVTSPSVVGYRAQPSTWMRTFLRAATGIHGPWAVHLYNDINEFHTYALSEFEREFPGPIWVTEVAGWQHFGGYKPNIARQARAIAYMFTVARSSYPHVARWYMYQWRGSPTGAVWDSGLLNFNGSDRPAIKIVQRNLLPPKLLASAG